MSFFLKRALLSLQCFTNKKEILVKIFQNLNDCLKYFLESLLPIPSIFTSTQLNVSFATANETNS